MEPITDTQLTGTNTITLTSCPTATIMSGNSSGSSASTHHHHHHHTHGQVSQMTLLSPKAETTLSPAGGEVQTTTTGSMATSKEDEEDSSNAASSDCKSPGQRYVNLCLLILFLCAKFIIKSKTSQIKKEKKAPYVIHSRFYHIAIFDNASRVLHLFLLWLLLLLCFYPAFVFVSLKIMIASVGACKNVAFAFFFGEKISNALVFICYSFKCSIQTK